MDILKQEYKQKAGAIKKRLREFESNLEKTNEQVFYELCFCLLTPQSKAVFCDRSITMLRQSGMLLKGGFDEIRSILYGVRFPNNKTRYLLHARELFCCDGRIKIKEKFNKNEIASTRDWLVNNVKGIGYKEASHFLRNIGLGKGIAILDVHILKNLKRFKVLKDIPKSISKKKYLEIENRMKNFATRLDIPIEELDLLLWSRETGFIFK